MLSQRAKYYYKNGYNCSQCILKACGDVYNIKINQQCIDMCKVVNNGLGVGSMCSVLMACVMVLGLLFDEETAKSKRIIFLAQFSERHKNISCSKLKTSDCTYVVTEAADLLENIIGRI